MNARFDSVRRRLRVLVLPDTDDVPPSRGKTLVSVTVAEPVGLDLLSPVVGVVGRPRRVFWTAVPETTVNEDDELDRPEDDVGSPAPVGKDGAVDPETETTGVQQPAKHDLRPGVPAPGASHAGTHSSGGRAELGSLRASERQATASRPCGVIVSR